MIVIIKILQVVLSLSILILIHEFGHFCFAKLFGIRVEKFYLFFDPGFALFKFKPKNSDTEYGIGWLPLGGYCKISGMIDESMDKEFLNSEPKPWEFRTKPAWQRLLVMSGGILFNLFFAFIVYIGLMAGWGESYISTENNSIYVNDLAYDMGFRNGDKILAIDDEKPERLDMLQVDIIRKTADKVTVLRNSRMADGSLPESYALNNRSTSDEDTPDKYKDTLDIYIDHNKIGEMLKSAGMFSPAVPFIVDTVPESSLNHDAGLMRGDKIITIAGKPVEYVQDSRKILTDYAGNEIMAGIIRRGDTLSLPLQVDTSGLLGIYTKFPEIKTKEYSIFSAIPAGIKHTFTTIGGYVDDLKLIFTPKTKAYKSVGSFIAIGQIFPAAWDWYGFLNILALLSIMLGVMNLLPIPALDGGHIVFTLYEMITGKKPSDKFLVAAQTVGMILLFAIMILAFGNDIGRLIR